MRYLPFVIHPLRSIRNARRHAMAFATVVIATAAATASAPAAAATPSSCYTCSPQCVPAARAWSGVNFPRVGYAREIPAAAKKAGFNVSTSPPIGRKSALVIALGSAGHALGVTEAKTDRTSGEVKLVVAHSNADCKCTSEAARATYKNGKVSFTSGMLKGRSYSVLGFVWK